MGEIVQSYLGYWGHGELQRWAGDSIVEIQLILLGEALVLGVGGSAVSRDKSVHRDVVLEALPLLRDS